MSAQDILAEQPRLSVAERGEIARTLRDLKTVGPHPFGRQSGLHAGAWEVAADFDEPLPESFGGGSEA